MRKQVELAQAFSRLLRESLGDSVIDEITRRNADEDNPDVCHSHSFIDANEVMLSAWRECGLDENSIVGDAPTDEARRLWQTAWDIAKEYDFEPGDDAESDNEQLIREAQRWI